MVTQQGSAEAGFEPWVRCQRARLAPHLCLQTGIETLSCVLTLCQELESKTHLTECQQCRIKISSTGTGLNLPNSQQSQNFARPGPFYEPRGLQATTGFSGNYSALTSAKASAVQMQMGKCGHT